jgi:hypothetical protein
MRCFCALLSPALAAKFVEICIKLGRQRRHSVELFRTTHHSKTKHEYISTCTSQWLCQVWVAQWQTSNPAGQRLRLPQPQHFTPVIKLWAQSITIHSFCSHCTLFGLRGLQSRDYVISTRHLIWWFPMCPWPPLHWLNKAILYADALAISRPPRHLSQAKSGLQHGPIANRVMRWSKYKLS